MKKVLTIAMINPDAQILKALTCVLVYMDTKWWSLHVKVKIYIILLFYRKFDDKLYIIIILWN